MFFSKIDSIKNVLSRASFIIDEYNVLLTSNNEYGHINIINDINRSISYLSDLNEALFFKELHIALKELKSQDSYSFKFFVDSFSSEHRNFIISSVSVYKSLNIKEISSNFEFGQPYYLITLIS